MSAPVSAEGFVPAILEAVAPGPLVADNLRHWEGSPPTAMLAIGKAAHAMVSAALDALPVRPRRALVLSTAKQPAFEVETLVGDHPAPTERNVKAAREVKRFVESLDPADSLLVLLSGGASALLCLPRDPLELGDLADVTDTLLRAGAAIQELNAVRKHCEVLKGGGLAAACSAGHLSTLILSDVLGDPIDVIGSGPTAADPTTFADALSVLERRGLTDHVPRVTSLLRRGAEGLEPETVKPEDPACENYRNVVIGGNSLAVDAACEHARALGYAVRARRELVEGEAAERARHMSRLVVDGASSGSDRFAIVWGGECTVTVGAATGRGGRNQEFSLAAAIEIAGRDRIRVLSLATDGIDGPTDAAGAWVDGTTVERIRASGIDPIDALARHDSHTALDATGALIRTGPTGTNVNDVMLALVG